MLPWFVPNVWKVSLLTPLLNPQEIYITVDILFCQRISDWQKCGQNKVKLVDKTGNNFCPAKLWDWHFKFGAYFEMWQDIFIIIVHQFYFILAAFLSYLRFVDKIKNPLIHIDGEPSMNDILNGWRTCNKYTCGSGTVRGIRVTSLLHFPYIGGYLQN